MGRAGLWAAGLGTSALVHLLAGFLLVPAYAPRDLASQPVPKSQVDLETLGTPRENARVREPEAEAAVPAEADSSAVSEAAVPQSRAVPLVPASERSDAIASAGPPLSAATPASAPLAEAALEAGPLRPVATAATTAPAADLAFPSLDAAHQLAAPLPTIVPPAAEAASLSLPPSEPVPVSDAPSLEITETEPASGALPSAQVATETVTASRPAPVMAPEAPAEGSLLALVAPAPSRVAPDAARGDDLPPARPETRSAPEADLPAERATAATAWAFADRVVTDPRAVATIQAFMAPEALERAGEVRDGLAGVLASVPCARLSATFVPETGALELRGHIPDPAHQGPLMEAFAAEVGAGLPVRANLLHLPAPQCGALTGIAAAGLPQSTDQFTDARLIGETAHARAYTYTEGQRLQFDLTAPDYDAYVYVDYFTADGDVIHLIPNATISLEKFAAGSTVGVGQDRPDRAGLRLTIGPPYGQEIAVAFAASAPLYDSLRPITEPAAPYLDFLKQRIALARSEDPGFKGEWVYFFITTRPATQ